MFLSLVATAAALTLDEAWQAAETGSNDLVIVHEQRVQTDTLRGQAWAALSPKLSLGGNWTLNQRETALDFSKMFPDDVKDMIEGFTGEPVDFGDPVVINKKSFFDWNLTVVQPIYSGRAIPGFFAANALVRAGHGTEDAQRAQVRQGIARAYWGVLVAREGEKVSDDALTLAKKHLEMANSLVSAGSATRQLALQAEIAVARAERDRVGAAARRVQAEQAFATATGLNTDEALSEPGTRELPYGSVEAALKRAEEHRPDLYAAEQQAKAARLAATASKMGWLPDVNARFTEAFSENTGFSGENYTWIFTVGATWTLWDGGFRIADNNKTASQARMAEAARDKATDEARNQVRNAWQERERARLALAAVEHELDLAEENLRIAEASLRAGAISFLDAEDARVGRDAARISVVSERMNLDLATIGLMAAAGDL